MENIRKMALELKLPYIKNNIEEIIAEAKQLGKSSEELINEILAKELETRRNNGIKNKIREAKFVYKKYLEDFVFERFNKETTLKLRELSNLEFIDNKENILLIGNPGMGKTHYAIGLGIKACLEGRKVFFINVPNLVIELKEAMSKNQITAYKKRFEKYDLVLLDELGYTSFDKEGSEILFNLISNRINVGSIIITSNLTFERWEEVFYKDPILTAALVDRIAHKSHLINMSGESYRMEETINWMKQIKSEDNKNG